MALAKSTMDMWAQRAQMKPAIEQQSFVDKLPQGPQGPSDFDVYKQAMNTASAMAGTPQSNAPDWMLKAQMYADQFKDKAQGMGDNLMALKSFFTGGM